MVRRRVSNHAAPALAREPSFETPASRAPQDEDLFLGWGFFLVATFFVADFFAALVATFAFFTALRAFGRLRSVARCAAASAALAQSASSSESSNNRAGNCQYEFTVTVLVRV